MDVVLVVGACVVLLTAVALVQTIGARSISARIHTLDQNLKAIDRSTRDEFATKSKRSADALQRLGASLVNAQSALGDAEVKQLQAFGSQLGNHTRSAAEEFAQLRTEVNRNIQSGSTATANSVADFSRVSIQRLDTLSSSLTGSMTVLEKRSTEELAAVRGACEPDVRPQLPRGVAGVLPQVVEQGQSAHVPALLLALLQAAHRPHRRVVRVGRRQSRPDVLVDLACEVVVQLLVQFPVQGLPVEQGSQPQPEHVQRAAHGQAWRTTREIAADRRSHCAVSSASARRPARVSV